MNISPGELLRVVPLPHGTILGGVELNIIMMVERPFGSKAKFSCSASNLEYEPTSCTTIRIRMLT